MACHSRFATGKGQGIVGRRNKTNDAKLLVQISNTLYLDAHNAWWWCMEVSCNCSRYYIERLSPPYIFKATGTTGKNGSGMSSTCSTEAHVMTNLGGSFNDAGPPSAGASTGVKWRLEKVPEQLEPVCSVIDKPSEPTPRPAPLHCLRALRRVPKKSPHAP